MGNENINSMGAHLVGEILKDHVEMVLRGCEKEYGIELGEDVKNITKQYLIGMIDQCVEDKDYLLGFCTYATMAVVDNACKMVHGKWIKELSDE